MSSAVKLQSVRAPGVAPGLSPHAPDILLPLRFVVTGLLAFLSGVVWLVVRPDILSTYHYNQYVIAVTHLFVLGWISTIVMGAMYQLVPVALETKLYSERLARWQFLFHVVGFAGMVWMLRTWNLKQVGHFGSVLTVGVGLFVYNILRTLLRVPRWNFIATGVASALAWFSVAVLAGLAIAVGKCSYESESALLQTAPVSALVHFLKIVASYVTHFDAISAMHAHAHLGSVGVFLMLIVGISYKLVPMFTLSEVQSSRRARMSIGLVNLGLLSSFFAVLLRSPLKLAGALVLILGLAIYGVELLAILRARKRRTLDWGLRYFLTALGLLMPLSVLGTVLAWPKLPLNAFTGQLENLYGFLAFMGVVSFAIIGMLYKIIPFLVWYRSYSSRIGLGKVPSLADLYSSGLQVAGYWTWLAGLATTSIGIVLGHALVVRFGCALFLLSLIILAANVAKMLSHLACPRVGELVQRPNRASELPRLVPKVASLKS